MANSIFAGMCISIGCIAYLKVGGVPGALLFSLGLLTVIVRGYELFTGKTCRCEWLLRPFRLMLCLLFNIVGCWALNLMCGKIDGVREAAVLACNTKLGRSDVAIFSAAILCGMLIAIAVRSGSKLDVVLAVMIFVLVGAEHVVADAFYMIAAGVELETAAIFIGKVALGNLIGGIVFSDLFEAKKGG